MLRKKAETEVQWVSERPSRLEKMRVRISVAGELVTFVVSEFELLS